MGGTVGSDHGSGFHFLPLVDVAVRIVEFGDGV